MQKKIGKFSQYDPASDRFMVSMPLIAQLGKNFNANLPDTDNILVQMLKYFNH